MTVQVPTDPNCRQGTTLLKAVSAPFENATWIESAGVVPFFYFITYQLQLGLAQSQASQNATCIQIQRSVEVRQRKLESQHQLMQSGLAQSQASQNAIFSQIQKSIESQQ